WSFPVPTISRRCGASSDRGQLWEIAGMNVPEKDEANPGCLGRGLLVSVVIAFAIGLMFLFPDGILPPAERVPCCAVIVLPGSIIWLARYVGKTKKVTIRSFGVALLVMAVMFL